MLYLVCYDVENNKIRTKIAKLLEKQGLTRVQLSVFVGLLSDLDKNIILEKIEQILDKKNQYSFILLPLHQDMLGTLTEFSTNPLDWEYLNGTKLCMVI